MRLLIAAIGRARGKSRDGPEARLLAEYLKRLPWQVALTELPQSRAATAGHPFSPVVNAYPNATDSRNTGANPRAVQ